MLHLQAVNGRRLEEGDVGHVLTDLDASPVWITSMHSGRFSDIFKCRLDRGLPLGFTTICSGHKPPSTKPMADLGCGADACDCLISFLHVVSHVPTGLGSGCCSITHKMHANSLSFHLVTGCWKTTVTWLNQSWFVTDSGVESLLPSMALFSVVGLFPWARPEALSAQQQTGAGVFNDAPSFLQPAFATPNGNHVDCDAGFMQTPVNNHTDPEPKPIDSDVIVDIRESLHRPGMLHNTNNLIDVLRYSMAFFPDDVAILKQLCNALRRAWSNNRLRDICFRELPAPHWETNPQQFDGQVQWGHRSK